MNPDENKQLDETPTPENKGTSIPVTSGSSSEPTQEEEVMKEIDALESEEVPPLDENASETTAPEPDSVPSEEASSEIPDPTDEQEIAAPAAAAAPVAGRSMDMVKQPAEPATEAPVTEGAETAAEAPKESLADVKMHDGPTQETKEFFKPAKKRPSPVFVIILIIVLLGGGAAAGYYAYQYFQSNSSEPAETTQVTESTPDASTVDDTIVDNTSTAVEDEADTLEDTIDALDDSEFNDASLSDSTLYE